MIAYTWESGVFSFQLLHEGKIIKMGYIKDENNFKIEPINRIIPKEDALSSILSKTEEHLFIDFKDVINTYTNGDVHFFRFRNDKKIFYAYLRDSDANIKIIK